MARAVGRGLPVSFKMSIEVCDFIRGKKSENAKALLNDVMEEKRAVPFKRFNKDLAHRKSIGPGRYPKKTAGEILRLLEAAEANAQFKGLNTSDLVINHIKADKAAMQWHYGRQRRRRMKRINVEIVLEEKKSKK